MEGLWFELLLLQQLLCGIACSIWHLGKVKMFLVKWCDKIFLYFVH